MAFPTIPTAANGRIIGTNQANATATRTSPNLSGLTRNNGDLLICVIVAYGSSAASGYFSSWTSGWTEFIDLGASDGMCVGAAYRWADGSESGTVQATQAATVTGHATIFLMAIAGVHPTTPPQGISLAQGTDTAANPTAMNPTGWGTEETLWMAIGGNGEVATGGAWTGTGTPPTNYSLGLDIAGSDVLNGSDGVIAFRQNAVESEDAGTFTTDTSNARNCAMVVAIRSHTIAGSSALESDRSPPAFPGIGRARSFDDVDDEITCAIGSAGVTGAFTIAALVQLRADGETHPVFGMFDSGNTGQLALEIASTATPSLRIGATTRFSDGAGGAASSLYPADKWAIVAISKAAGTVEPSFHVWKQSTGTWDHTGSLADLTVGNPGASTYVWFARSGAVYGEIDLAVAGVWNVELTSTQIEELAGGATQDWLDQSGGAPVALWEFNQASTVTDVLDLVGSANQTAIVGTSVGQGPANPAWTFKPPAQVVEAGVASENDTVPSGTVLQSQPPVAAGTASENDSALAGTYPALIPGGRALESDNAIPLVGFPGIGYGRSFDDVDDEITCAIGSAGVTGAFTIAALVRVRVSSEFHPVFGMYDGTDTCQLGLEIASSAAPELRIGVTTRFSEGGASLYPADQWAVVAIAKAAGVAEPGFHVWKQSTGTWSHVGAAFDLTVGNPGASSYVKFGRIGVTGLYGEIDLGVAAVWNVELTNLQIEELSGGTTQDWLDQSGGTPVALWEFDQESVGTDVLDVVGAADQTAIVGTSVGQGPANPAWTYLQPQTISAGVASENDSAPGGTPVTIVYAGIATEDDTASAPTVLQGFFRRWDGIDDRLEVTNNASAFLWDNLTMAALVRRRRDGQEEYIFTDVLDFTLPTIGIGFNAANQIILRINYPGTIRKTTTNTVTVSDGWVIVAVSKAGGVSTPRAHVWKQGSGWAHENLDGTLPNPPSQVNGYIDFGVYTDFLGIGYAQIDLETAGEWPYNLTDEQVEELSANWATLDWFSNSGGIPCGLWNFTQSVVGEGAGDTGVIDLTGGEAGPYGITEGTEVGVGAPVRSSDGKVWNPWTPLVGGRARETDGWGNMQGRVVQTFGVAIENESVPAGTVGAQPQTIFAGIAVESNVGNSGIVIPTIGQAVETDSAQIISVFKSITIGQAVETDEAQAITSERTYAVAQASETDSAQLITVVKTLAIGFAQETDESQLFVAHKYEQSGQAVESDAAFAISAQRAYPVSQAVETDEARTIILSSNVIFVDVNQAIETDSAQASISKKIYAVAQTEESDQPQAITAIRSYAVGQAVETNESQAIIASHSSVVAQASETDSAQIFTYAKNKAIGQTEETDFAYGIASGGAHLVSPAEETDFAQTFESAKVLTVDQAVESDSSQAISAQRNYALDQAAELDEAESFNKAKTTAIGRAFESDTAQSIAVIRTVDVGQAVESDTAELIESSKIEAIGQALESDAAQVISHIITIAVGQAAETDSSQAITSHKTRNVGQAIELEEAGSFGGARVVLVNQAVESDVAQSVASARIINVGQAVESDFASAISASKAETLNQAVEIDEAQAINPTRFIAIGQTNELGSSQPINPAKFVAIGQAQESDAANIIRTQGVFPLYGAEETDQARPMIRRGGAEETEPIVIHTFTTELNAIYGIPPKRRRRYYSSAKGDDYIKAPTLH